MPGRRQTIPNSVSSGGDPCVVIKNVEWGRLEKALGIRIPTKLRTDIIAITEKFLRHVFVEPEPTSSKPSKARLDRIAKAANQLATAIRQYDVPHDAKRYANSLIEKHLAKLRPPNDIYDLAEFIDSACRKAKKDFALGKNAGPVQLGNWNGWICCLDKLLISHKIKPTVRKDYAMSKRMSPYVRFIGQLEMKIPKHHRRGSHSLGALAEAIIKARSGRKPRTIEDQ